MKRMQKILCFLFAVFIVGANVRSAAGAPETPPIPLNNHQHVWSEVFYTWSEDYSICTVERICENCTVHKVEITVASTPVVITVPTDTENGMVQYTAVFSDPYITQVKSAIIPAGATILWGDVNQDDAVNTADIIRLKNFLAGVARVTIGIGSDANGDGKVDAADVTRLKNYLANFDFSTGHSTVSLGP